MMAKARRIVVAALAGALPTVALSASITQAQDSPTPAPSASGGDEPLVFTIGDTRRSGP